MTNQPPDVDPEQKRRAREAYDHQDDVPASIKQRRRADKNYDPMDDLPVSIKRRLSHSTPAAEPPERPEEPVEDPAAKRQRETTDMEQALALMSAFEMHLEIPDRTKENKAWRRFQRDPSAFTAAALKKGAAKIVMRKLDPQMKDRFREAKQLEISSWLGNQVTAAAQRTDAGAQGPMRMR